MRRVLVVRTVTPATLEISSHDSSLAEWGGVVIPEPFDLVLAGLGECTANAMIDHAASNGWRLDAIHVDLGLFGEVPWQAIGRRIRVGGDIDASQLASLLDAAEQSPVAAALRPTVHIQSQIAHAALPMSASDKLEGVHQYGGRL